MRSKKYVAALGNLNKCAPAPRANKRKLIDARDSLINAIADALRASTGKDGATNSQVYLQSCAATVLAEVWAQSAQEVAMTKIIGGVSRTIPNALETVVPVLRGERDECLDRMTDAWADWAMASGWTGDLPKSQVVRTLGKLYNPLAYEQAKRDGKAVMPTIIAGAASLRTTQSKTRKNPNEDPTRPYALTTNQRPNQARREPQ
mgnify:CR=1 FL=1